MERLPRIKTVSVLVDRKVQLQFTDGVQREVDLRPYLRGPVFEAILKDDSVFRTVRVDAQLGTLTWDNGADMDPDVLYGSHIPTWMEKETFTKAI
jgi:hypothetical protein